MGERSPLRRLPVAHLNELQNKGTILQNCYLQELFAPRLSGSVLNIGAGTANLKYRHAEMFGVAEYHTLEPSAEMQCTFVASATDMQPVESNRYDWVMSTAVLEHVDDPWAAAREHIRAAKPGGFIYVVVPFDQVMHPAKDFGDYFRFTPQGVRKMFESCRVLEVETWGDSPLTPNGFALLMQKPGTAVLQSAERYFWLEFDNDEPFAATFCETQPNYQWMFHEVLLEPMRLAMEINRIRDQLYAQSQVSVSASEVAQRYKEQFIKPFGILGCKDGVSFFNKV